MQDPYIAYLEMKRRTGDEAEDTSYVTFLFQHRRLLNK